MDAFEGEENVITVKADELSRVGVSPTDVQSLSQVGDADDGYVGLFKFFNNGPEADIVNSTLDDFIEFLRLFGMRAKMRSEVSADELREYTSNVAAYLRERDSFAFEASDNWWSSILDRLHQQEANAQGDYQEIIGR
ncbi:SUKH-4 family immunity protein [Streptomyces sp. NPDC002730]|uniref:SUKH-4 family immunity protein n=1 Tax=Streptomyces sp. NPDC002730 TaxID=3364662 RepID=UPI0036801CA5